MDCNEIYQKANSLIADTYGQTEIPEQGYVVVSHNDERYKVYFIKRETGWDVTDKEKM